jgi:hypothetical protein
LKPLVLSGPFRARVRDYPKETRGKIGLALQAFGAGFWPSAPSSGFGHSQADGEFLRNPGGTGHPAGFPKSRRMPLFVMVGNHDEVQKFLRGL